MVTAPAMRVRVLEIGPMQQPASISQGGLDLWIRLEHLETSKKADVV